MRLLLSLERFVVQNDRTKADSAAGIPAALIQKVHVSSSQRRHALSFKSISGENRSLRSTSEAVLCENADFC